MDLRPDQRATDAFPRPVCITLLIEHAVRGCASVEAYEVGWFEAHPANAEVAYMAENRCFG